jgi:tetratricopeptide (TPR) repeat protein
MQAAPVMTPAFLSRGRGAAGRRTRVGRTIRMTAIVVIAALRFISRPPSASRRLDALQCAFPQKGIALMSRKPQRKSKGAKRGRSHASKAGEAAALDAAMLDRRALEKQMWPFLPAAGELDSKLDAAQQIVYQAYEQTSRSRRIALARQALDVSSDCADAYVLLAEHAPTPAAELALYEQGVAAGERALGEERFEEDEGHFWGFMETRPYMRARAGLAECLWRMGRREEAAAHFRAMLRLNPNDNQGLRYRLSALLLDLQLHDELERLLEQYGEEASAEWAYTRALLAFRLHGDTASARQDLKAATKVNKHVPAYLARIKPMPRGLPQYITPGGEDEAVGYAASALPAWKETPGAVPWLRSVLNLNVVNEAAKKGPPWSKLQPALRQIPQRVGETWILDMRQVAATADCGTSDQWMLIALKTEDGQVAHFDFSDERPTDAQALRFLIAALSQPYQGEPHRPSVIQVARQTWRRAWEAKLREIGIECQLRPSLAPLDRWLETAMPQLEKMAPPATSSPADGEWSALLALPQQAGEIWQAGVERLPVWLHAAGEAQRPLASLVVDGERELIVATNIASDEGPEDCLRNVIWQALNSPAVGEAHRPGTIHVALDAQRELLAPHLAPLGIQCVTNPALPQFRMIMAELFDRIGVGEQPNALIRSPGVAMAQLGDLFEAAAQFYRDKPWRRLPGDSIIRVACDRFQSGPWWAAVMGQAGIEQGLALYEDPELLASLIREELSEEESARRNSVMSLMFGEAFELAPEDVDAAEEHGWTIAGPEAWPFVVRVVPGRIVRAPLKWELELLEGCLRAIPELLRQNVSTTSIGVTVSGEPATFHLDRIARFAG